MYVFFVPDSLQKLFCIQISLLLRSLTYYVFPPLSLFSGLPLQTNTSVASSLGTYFLAQISLIFLDMLNVYRYDFALKFGLNFHIYYVFFIRVWSLDILEIFLSGFPPLSNVAFFGTHNTRNRMYSELISTNIAEGGPFASKTSYVKLLR